MRKGGGRGNLFTPHDNSKVQVITVKFVFQVEIAQLYLIRLVIFTVKVKWLFYFALGVVASLNV